MAESRRIAPRTIYLVATLGVVLVLCLSLTICLAGSPRPPQLSVPAVATSEEAALSAEDKINAAAEAPLGPFSVTLSQEEVTSLLALRVPESPFLRPQIHFNDGRAYISGVVSMGTPLTVNSMWTVADESGRPRLRLERASIGPIALPTALLASVSSTINEMIAESGTGVTPTAVRIGEGSITIEGDKSTPSVP
jgi:hypothetical protein